EAALELLGREDVAVVVSDQRMPGMTGTELLTRGREIAPDAVRILLTAFTDLDALMESINAAGVYHFLLKPWDPKELRHLVGRAVEHHRLRTEGDLVRETSVRAQLQRYVSPRLVDLAIANPDLLPATGDWREATVLFADIRGFTRLTESAPAPVVIGLLDEYFTEMIDVIFRHHGTVEQLVGDEIVALFGVPEAGPDVALRAVRAATDMVAAVRRLAERWAADGRPTFDIGVGISSGPVMAGKIGSDPPGELRAVGGGMIAASRIQRMTRLFDAHIIVEEATFHQVDHLVRCRELGRPRLKGIR